MASQTLPGNLPPLQADTADAGGGLHGALPVVELVAPLQLPETIDLTSEPEELFQRMRQGFAMPNINNALVLHYQQWYLNHPESLRRMVERSSRYLHHIVEEIEKRGMPMELALLPMVESAYNPTAYSRSHASGLWQFVPATGKQYKLQQNWWVDERRDIVASTAAALEYLQYIYDLHGDWHLALASYNWGEGAVGRAINKNKASGLPTDYQRLNMPEETRHYVPKLQALKNVFSNPNILASLNIRGVPNRPYFATVTQTANIDVKLAAKLAEMPVQEFVALNPAHNRPVIKSETPMVIPADKVNTFISNLEAHEESEQPLSSWQAYTLRAGDKLEEVAPRFGMTVANLKAVNGISGRIRVAPGLTLLVAGHEGTSTADLTDLADQPGQQAALQPPLEQRLREAPIAATRTIAAEPPRIAAVEARRLPTPEAPPATRTHTVGKGETLLRIAQRYDMSLAELKAINKLRANQVNAGTRLSVTAPDAIGKPQRATLAANDSKQEKQDKADSKQTVTRSAAQSVASSRSHTVRKGETLSQVASRYDLSVAELKQINKLKDNQVNAGTRLMLAAAEPVSKPAADRARGEVAESRLEKTVKGRPSLARTEARTVEKTGSKAGASEQNHRGGRKQMKVAQYTIRQGDTLVSIARQFRVEKDDILRWNRIESKGLKPGKTLTIQLVQNAY
ncbi:MAG: LysM peptidoglycan-binding domain-containing protein [Candidatus Accumulibacter sp. UW20]